MVQIQQVQPIAIYKIPGRPVLQNSSLLFSRSIQVTSYHHRGFVVERLNRRVSSNASFRTWNCFRTRKKRWTWAGPIDHAASRPRILQLCGNRSRAPESFRLGASAIPWGRSSLGLVSTWKLSAALLLKTAIVARSKIISGYS